MRYEPPSLTKNSFSCPHCAAYAAQAWFLTYAASMTGNAAPGSFGPDDLAAVEITIKDEEARKTFFSWSQKILSRNVHLHKEEGLHGRHSIVNLHLTRCFACEQIAVWINDRVVWPAMHGATPPNPDLPPDVLMDYQEAAAILHSSPRGSAALLRLAIEKLCASLGETGNINSMIASLVRKGLDQRIQQALDVVRVIGNEAVHPGTIDLRDDSDTAGKLFTLVNIICDALISQPRQINQLYASLPEDKRKGIENRNLRAKPSDD